MRNKSKTSGTREQHMIQWCLAAFVILVAIKFLAILVEANWDLGKSPYGLLVVVVVPAVLLAALVGRRPRTGSALVAAAMVLWIVTVLLALLRDGFSRGSLADYVFAYGGMVVAFVAIGSSLSLWRSRPASHAPLSARVS